MLKSPDIPSAGQRGRVMMWEVAGNGALPLAWRPVPEAQCYSKGGRALGEEEVEERGAMVGDRRKEVPGMSASG